MIAILATNGEPAYNITEFLADSEDDLVNIPRVHVGDRVYVVASQEWLILSSAGIWEPLKDNLSANEHLGG